MIKNSLKIKHHGYYKLIFSKKLESIPESVNFSYIVDEKLEDLLIHLKVKIRKNIAGVSKDYVVIHVNNDTILDNNHIKFEISDIDENFINDKINKSDKIKKAHKNGEFEIITIEVEDEL